MWKRIAFAGLTLIVLALLASCGGGDSIARAREGILRQNLFTLRALIDQYTTDLHRRPQSLADLVAVGYIKQLPADPMTGRSDTWVLEFSSDPKMPGIANVRSAARAISSNGTAYSDW